MTEYIIDIIIDNIREDYFRTDQSHTLYIKIDKNGNVDIKIKCTIHQNGMLDREGPIHDFLIINDNIPIPSYIINMFKNSFCQVKSEKLIGGSINRGPFYLNHYVNSINNIFILKEDIGKSQSTIIDLI